MTGVAVKGKDRAGGKQDQQANDWFTLDGDPVVTVGDTVEGHGEPPHGPTPTMVEGADWFQIGDRPVSRAEHKASCGHATTGRQWFVLECADDGYRKYLTDPADPCNVEHIPWIMRANGWHEGAKLMDQWFSKPASTEKKLEDSDTTTMTMDWVLELPEAKAAYDELMDESLWSIPNGNPPRRPIDRFCDKLSDGGYLTNTPKTFSFEDPVWKMKGRLLDNRVIRNGAVFIYDKWGAALGVFELLSFVEGEVRPLPDGSHEITIKKKGVLVEDQYDFEGGQYFGYWNIETHSASLLPDSLFPPCKRWVDNEAFRTWRQLNNLGGDYFVYSDLKQITLERPYVFYCPTRF